MNSLAKYVVLTFCLFLSLEGYMQSYSLLIKGGHVIDPKNNIDKKMDVAITDGKIALVADNINERLAATVIHAEGLYVTPGLIDMHSHHFFGTLPDRYLCNGLEALPPDGFTFRCGVTTVVDAGSSGWRSFKLFKEQTIQNSKTRVLAFLNIVGEGMRGGPYEQNLNDMDSKMTALVVQQNPELVGIKVAHYSGGEWDPVDRAVEAGKIANVPVMIDFGEHQPPFSLEELLLKHLRPGDIFTHAFANVSGRMSVVDKQDQVYPFVWTAQKRGIIFDLGHGGGSFAFSQAIPAVKAGFLPNTISTDLHTGSMNAGMKDMTNVMSKLINLGMSLQQVISRSTWIPAQTIKREQLGHLSAGAGADVAIFNLREGKFGFIDAAGYRMDGTKKLECEMTIRDGKVVYDLNGLSRPAWDTK